MPLSDLIGFPVACSYNIRGEAKDDPGSMSPGYSF